MARPNAYFGRLPEPDSRGRWRPFVGRDLLGKQVRFQVGNREATSEGEALKRLNAIRHLYDRQCKEFSVDHWEGYALQWAYKLAQGIPIMVYAEVPDLESPGRAAETLEQIRRLQSWGVPIVVADPQLTANGTAFLQEAIDRQVKTAVAEVMNNLKSGWGEGFVAEAQQGLPPDLTTAPQGQFHEALEAMQKHIRATGGQDQYGNLSANNRKYIEWLDMLKEHHADFPLWQLNYTKIETIISYWRNRPKTKRGSRCSVEHANKMTRQFLRFLKWLEQQPQHRWEMPTKLGQIDTKPIKLKEDDQKHATAFRSVTKKTYTPEQLAVLAQHTDDLGRALLGVCVNCAFGASEVGQLSVSDYQLYHAHPYAKALGIESTAKDSWVVCKRPKTGIYGEHLLWEEVAKALKPFLSDGREVLPVSGSGKPWYRPYSKNAQSGFQQWFSSLLKRVRATEEHKDFPLLPFGSLRDLLPNVLRQNYSDEVASLALHHGSLSSDNLLDNYANLPYAKLFQATRELQKHFKPFLEAL